MQNVRNTLPRWRGFNLLGLFTAKSDGFFPEEDFRWAAGWGFDYIRLPMSYRWWGDPAASGAMKESVLAKIDEAVDYGAKYGVHVCLNFHRAPGYCVNRGEEEPFNLWKDAEALDAFCRHWRVFAERYRGIPSERLSFDLVNEPPGPSPDGMTRSDHERVIRAAVAAIREIDPLRLIAIDGVSWGNDPSPELADLAVAQSCRAYQPMAVSHYKAEWVNSRSWPEPVWPGATQNGIRWDRRSLEEHYSRWAALLEMNVGVHCGEGGAYRHTPHGVFLDWFRDVLEILTACGIGYALWNFRGSFDILDSGRSDVEYEDWHGHKLDRKLLSLLQEF